MEKTMRKSLQTFYKCRWGRPGQCYVKPTIVKYFTALPDDTLI